MKRQISICVFLSIILIILAFVFVKVSNRENTPKQNTEIGTQVKSYQTDKSVNQIQTPKHYKYYIISEMGRLTVYENETGSVFMDTAIETSLLPSEIQKKLKNSQNLPMTL